jgi:CubicO group peptidase (beta-lactamase class C family)
MRAGTAIFLTVAGLASGASAAPFDFSEVTALANGALVGQNVNSPVPGFELLLLKDGVVVYRRSFGTWSLGRVGNADSATKTLAGALIMSLVDSSPLPFSLDTKLSEYIPAFGGNKANINIRQCFSHTSGLGDSIFVGSETLSLQEVAQRIPLTPLEFSPPGTAFSYGGTSMHAAGAVAEIVGQKPWNTLFAERILAPVGMTHTSFVLSTPINPRIAGGCESNAPDFSIFMETLRRGGLAPNGARVLSQHAVNQLFTRQTADPITILNTPVQSPTTDGADYGVGVWLDERDASGKLIGALAAGARGFSSWIDFDDGMVGVFATDLSAAGNVQGLLYLFRAAAQEAARQPLCPPDLDHDAVVADSDFAAFITAYNANDCASEDMTPGCQADLNHDGFVDDADFAVFLVAYNAMICP